LLEKKKVYRKLDGVLGCCCWCW